MRHTRLILAALGLAATTAAARAGVSHRQAGPDDPRELATFVDSVMRTVMAREHIPGAAFVFVRDGRVFLSRGYGLADVARGRRVVAESTIFRVGSISKVFTATALVQLADRGRIDLGRDVNDYLRRVRVPTTYAEPVTGEQLLDHTAGFDEIRPGTQASTADSLLPLSDFLRPRLVRIRPPGRSISYSTYGVTLAGELVEELSGLTFEDYLARNIWRPLGMTRTSITVPEALRADVAMGYDIRDGVPVPAAWEWYHTTPASSVNSTAADMARFMIAHLQDGQLGEAQVLSPRAARYMHRQHATMHPRLPGFALGFYEDYAGGLRILEHGGNMAGFSSLMVLVPEANAGFFVVNHVESSRLRDELKWALLARYYPRARERLPVPKPSPDAAPRLARFAGRWAPTTGCHSCTPRRVPAILPITANADGTLGFTGGRFIEVEPMLFVHDDGTGYIAFRADSTGQPVELFAGGFWSFERLPQPAGTSGGR